VVASPNEKQEIESLLTSDPIWARGRTAEVCRRTAEVCRRKPEAERANGEVADRRPQYCNELTRLTIFTEWFGT
jgi:hypothetical protein